VVLLALLLALVQGQMLVQRQMQMQGQGLMLVQRQMQGRQKSGLQAPKPKRLKTTTWF